MCAGLTDKYILCSPMQSAYTNNYILLYTIVTISIILVHPVTNQVLSCSLSDRLLFSRAAGTCRRRCGACLVTCRRSCMPWWAACVPVSVRACAASGDWPTAPPSHGTTGRRCMSTRLQVGQHERRAVPLSDAAGQSVSQHERCVPPANGVRRL